LFLGTHADNAADREAKGRGRDSRGEHSGHHKLNAAEVSEIRRRYDRGGDRSMKGGTTQQQLAEEFGVHQATISTIVRRKTWLP
jgi:hypothetical protein